MDVCQVWRADYEELLDQLCVDSDPTVRSAALLVVTRSFETVHSVADRMEADEVSSSSSASFSE